MLRIVAELYPADFRLFVIFSFDRRTKTSGGGRIIFTAKLWPAARKLRPSDLVEVFIKRRAGLDYFRSPTSRPDRDFGPPSRMICLFLPSDCPLLVAVLSPSPALVFGMTFLPTSLQKFSTLSVNFQKTSKTGSLPTFLPWLSRLSPNLTSHSVWSLW